jgi:hypothetical protein
MGVRIGMGTYPDAPPNKVVVAGFSAGVVVAGVESDAAGWPNSPVPVAGGAAGFPNKLVPVPAAGAAGAGAGADVPPNPPNKLPAGLACV